MDTTISSDHSCNMPKCQALRICVCKLSPRHNMVLDNQFGLSSTISVNPSIHEENLLNLEGKANFDENLNMTTNDKPIVALG